MQNEQILGFIRQHGPVLPYEIAKLLNTNILFASAHLSELASKGLVKISHLKVGGSPLYYLPGQEHMLQKYADKLHEKERRAFEQLKKEMVLKDASLLPVVRFALRQIKDFARPFELEVNGRKELFWCWYLSPKDTITQIIKDKYLKQGQATAQKQPTQQRPVAAPQLSNETKKSEVIKKEVTVESATTASDFISRVIRYLESHKIEIEQQSIIKKGKHAWFIAKVPTTLGHVNFYIEAKDKKRVNEADLSEAYVRANNKHLPAVFITTGKPTKSTVEALNKLFKSMMLKPL